MLQQLIGYIQRERDKGFGYDEIEKALIDVKYPKDMIDKAIKAYQDKEEAKKKEKQQKIRQHPISRAATRYKYILLYASLAFAIIIIISFLLSGLLGLQEQKDTTENEEDKVPGETNGLQDDALLKDYDPMCLKETRERGELCHALYTGGMHYCLEDNPFFADTGSCFNIFIPIKVTYAQTEEDCQDMEGKSGELKWDVLCQAYIASDIDYCKNNEGCTEESYNLIQSLAFFDTALCDRTQENFKDLCYEMFGALSGPGCEQAYDIEQCRLD